MVAEAHPHRVRELMAYLRMIVPEAQRHGGDGWRSYDVLFRKIAAANFALRWGSHYRRYTPHRFWQLGHQQRLRERTAAKVTTSQESAHCHLSQRHSPKAVALSKARLASLLGGHRRRVQVVLLVPVLQTAQRARSGTLVQGMPGLPVMCVPARLLALRPPQP